MAVTYTGNLKLGLPVTGTEIGAWGDIVNQQITTPLDQAISGTVSLTSMTNADYTLANGDGALTNEARYMALLVPATLTLTAARNIIVPDTSKLYLVTNNSAGSFAVTVKTAGGAGVAVLSGARAFLYCDGTDVVSAVASPLPATYAVGDLVYASTTTSLTPLADVAVGNALISGGVGTAPSYGKVGLTTHISGTLAAANGGTGITAPGTAGNVLQSTGSAWQSAAIVTVPTGAINMWPTDTPPTGWLLADGSDISRTTYATLFAVIGTTFGSGSGSTFTLPNYTNRMPIGSGGAYALAGIGGSANAVVVSHSHTATSTVTDPSHAHNATAGVFVLNGAGGADSAGGSGFISGGSGSATTATATTGVTVSTSVSTEGSSSTNANLPPYLGIRFIIKT